MSRALNLTNLKFGRLTAIERVSSCSTGAQWKCVCTCGVETIVSTANLRSGSTKSCGCLAQEIRTKNNITHGVSNHIVYKNVYTNMLARCHNIKYPRYKDYGGKGITVCSRWRNSPIAFINWALQNGYKKGVHLHRKDKKKGYTPVNCEFVHRLQHIREHNAKLSIDDVVIIKQKRDKLLRKLAKKYNVDRMTMRAIFFNKSWVDV